MAVDQSLSDARLNDETLSELGLTEQPFVDNKKHARFSDSAAQKIRASLEQKLRFGQSVHLLTGDQGVGKTVFLSQLFKHCKNNLKPFVAKGDEQFSARAFLAAVQYQLAGEAEEYESIHDYIDVLIPQFEKLSDEKMGAVLTIDDAHKAPIEEVAELIQLMPVFVTEDDEITARLLLAGEPQLADELNAVADEFDSGVYQPTETSIPALDNSRIHDYLSSRLKQAGHADAFPFSDKSIAKILRDSGGLPGKINESAANYLNQVYSAAPEKLSGGGFISALGWPLIALGTAAVGLIALGLSMFFTGGEPDPVVTIEPTPAAIENTEPTVAAAGAATDVTDRSALILEENQQTASADPDTSGTSVADNPSDNILTGNADTMDQTTQSDGLLNSEDQQVAVSGNDAGNDPGNIPATEEVTGDGGTLVKETVTQIVEAPETSISPQGTETVIAQSPGDNAADAGAELVSRVNDTVSQRAEQISADVQRSGTTVTDNDSSTTEQVAQSIDVQSIGQVNAEALPESVEVIISGASNTAALDTDATNEDSDAAAVDAESPAGGVAIPVEPTLPGNNGVALGVDDSADAVPAIARAVENERWVLFQDAGKFTVQLATSRERGYIIDLAQTLPAEEPIAIYPFLTTNSKNPVFGLLSGLYNTRQEALNAVQGMNPEAKQFGTWIRPIGDLQADIKAGN